MWFDGGHGNTQVLIVQDDNYVYAWVGIDKVGLLVAFEPEHQVCYGLDESGVRAALALAIGWYLDVSVSLRKTSAGTHTIHRSHTGTATTGYRYVPKPSFTAQVSNVRNGIHRPPRAHGRVAHLRTYTGGQTPSATARNGLHSDCARQ